MGVEDAEDMKDAGPATHSPRFPPREPTLHAGPAPASSHPHSITILDGFVLEEGNMGDDGRIGSWIETRSGLRAWPLDLRPEEVCLSDIADALAHICRYAGHVPITVAAHSLMVAAFLRETGRPGIVQMHGLLHDAPEAYLTDLPTPIKHHPDLKLYREAEDRALTAIYKQLQVPEPSFEENQEVKRADRILLFAETRQWLPSHGIQHMASSPLPRATALAAWDRTGLTLNGLLLGASDFAEAFHALKAAGCQGNENDRWVWGDGPPPSAKARSFGKGIA